MFEYVNVTQCICVSSHILWHFAKRGNINVILTHFSLFKAFEIVKG